MQRLWGAKDPVVFHDSEEARVIIAYLVRGLVSADTEEGGSRQVQRSSGLTGH